MTDGGMAISFDVVTGTAGRLTGDMWTADDFISDQYSQIRVTSAPLEGDQWIGLAVRARDGGKDAYVGVYDWNHGHPELKLFQRTSGTLVHIGAISHCGVLAPGTELELAAVGSTITFLENDVVAISVSSTALHGGAPGIMAYGSAEADDWSGGDTSADSDGAPGTFAGNSPEAGPTRPLVSVPHLQATYLSTSPSGVEFYRVVSGDDGGTPQTVQILRPTDPTPGVAHNFLYVLPVEKGLSSTFGDGMETMIGLNAQNRYNLTIIEPTFGIDPWYADNPINPSIRYETFMTRDLVPWVKKNFAFSGHEQNWLIGFSKSGIGAQDLILRHPDIFTLAASWDFPADMARYNQYGPSSTVGYGTNANFQYNYRLTAAFLDAHKGPFLGRNRIWIGGYAAFKTDVADYAALLTSEGIAYSGQTPLYRAHGWYSGWVAAALAALYHDSVDWSASA